MQTATLARLQHKFAKGEVMQMKIDWVIEWKYFFNEMEKKNNVHNVSTLTVYSPLLTYHDQINNRNNELFECALYTASDHNVVVTKKLYEWNVAQITINLVNNKTQNS